MGSEKISIGVELFSNNFPTFLAAPAEPAVFVRIGDKISDASWQVQVANDWRQDDVPNYTFQTGLMEWRDYRKQPKDWQKFEDDSTWQQASVIDSARPIYTKKLFYRDVALMEVTKILPARIAGVYSVDATGEMSPEEVAAVMTDEQHLPLELDLTGLCSGENVVIRLSLVAEESWLLLIRSRLTLVDLSLIFRLMPGR